MTETGRVAVAKFTLRNKEHACVLRAYEDTLALSPLLYKDEVRPTEGLKKPSLEEVDEKTLAIAKQYVEALTTDFDHAAYVDGYRSSLLALIDEKAAALKPPERTPAASALPDLMAALRTAVEQATKKKAVGRRQKAPAST